MEELRYSSWMLVRVDIGDTVRLRLGVSTIGRHSSSVIRIFDSAYVSRHHAEIEVTEDDRKVYITDLQSINGIFVNDVQYSRQRVEIHNNDRIGIGFTTNMEEAPENILQLPIFELKYAPLRQIRPGNAHRPTAAPLVISSPTPPSSPVEENTVKSNEQNCDNSTKKNNNNSNLNDDKPCCSKTVREEQKPFNDEIFEISDDDECDAVEPANTNPQSSIANKKPENLNEVIVKKEPEDLVALKSSQNCGLNVNLNTDSDSKNIISSSQKQLQTIQRLIFSTDIHKAKERDKDTTKNKDTEKQKETTAQQAPERLANNEVTLHVPILSQVKKEIIRSVSADIENIFGVVEEDVEMQQKIKEINPLVYNEIQTSKKLPPLSDDGKTLNNGDLIILTDDEDEEMEKLPTITTSSTNNKDKKTPADVTISPNIFDSSLNSSKEDANEAEIKKDLAAKAPADNIDLDEYTKYAPNSDDEDIEDLMFSQVLIDDMKAEFQDNLEDVSNLPLPIANVTATNVVAPVVIKQEPQTELFAAVPKELENSCWIISDDEDFDKELETKVNDWSNKIFSQSFNQMSMSQVYDLNEPDNQVSDEDDDEVSDDNFDFLEDDLDNIAELYSNNNEKDKYDDYNDSDVKLKTPDVDKQKPEETLKDFKAKKAKEQEIKDEKAEQRNDFRKSTKNEESFPTKVISDAQKSPIKEVPMDSEAFTDSPIIRPRRLSKTKPVVESTSSSDDDMEVDNQKLPQPTKDPEKQKSEETLKDFKAKKAKEQEIKDEKAGQRSDFRTSTKNEESFPTNVISDAQKTPIKEVPMDSKALTSPIIRLRRLSKTKPVVKSSSSSDDDMEVDDQKLPQRTKDQETTKPLTRLPPPIIDAPSLPKHKGKLRGLSAELHKKTSSIELKTAGLRNKMCSIKDKIKQDKYRNDLEKKWLEKPSLAKKRDKERSKLIKEHRKDKLKELAEKRKSPCKENMKRKLSTEEPEHKAKIAKIKVTAQNRGAFLVSNEPLPPPATKTDRQFKIPKIQKKSDETAIKRSHSVDSNETFSQQLSKPDSLLLQQPTLDAKKSNTIAPSTKVVVETAPIRRHSLNGVIKEPTGKHTKPTCKSPPPASANAICKEAVAARAIRTTNKITFASMEKHIVEQEEMQRKLAILNTNNATSLTPLNQQQAPPLNLNKSCLKSYSSTILIPSNAVKKTVRFNDTPVVHYIERVSGANKKVINKDIMPMTTYRDRRISIRSTYPIIDNTNALITDILRWSNEWLIKRNAAADAASEVVFPMPTHFNSFDHYQSIVFPLMKLEFVSLLEREYIMTQNVKNFKVSLDYATLNNDRIMLVTKLNSQNRESTQYDLVILESDKRGPQIFAYIATVRKGTGSLSTFVMEIMAKNFTVEYFKSIKEFVVRPVMDRVRVHFGAFNSVYQLQATPLFPKIINPFELFKCKSPPKKKVIYRGFDNLNDKQRQVLLNTYTKIIDETTPNITLIQGPPGTGKSCVITNLVLQCLYGDEVRYLDKKILICAQSNAAVDVIAGKLYDVSMRMRIEKRFRLIRYGMLGKIHPTVLPVALQNVVEHDQLKKLKAKNKDLQIENKENLKNQIMEFEAKIAEMSSRNVKGTVEEDILIEKQRQLQLMRNILNQSMRPEDERSLFTWYLSNANIVCTTLASCVNLMQYINFFDICIIDEATQSTEPWTLLPLKFGINSLVLVGDTQQLPATVLSKKANELGLGTSLFTRIQNCLDNIACTRANKDANTSIITPANIIYSLQTQYRMHPEICRWPNQYFYRNELINAKLTMDIYKTPLVPFSILSLAYTQNNSCSNGQITNNLEAEFVAKLLKALDGFIPNKYNSYGVITPYAHHRSTLESSIRSLGLTNIMVNTIDSYQGLEKDVIVISNARTNGIGFLANPQRLNVALTRAKKCLILCGNFKNLEAVPAWRCLLQNARERKLYHEITVNCIADIQANVIEKIKLKNQNLSTS